MSASGASTPKPVLTVVVPTRDRPDRLAETLRAIASQRLTGRSLVESIEVVVVDDGSSDPAVVPRVVEQTLSGSTHGGGQEHAASLRGRVIRLQPRASADGRGQGQGPAAARNRGVAAARAARVLFLGDDTRPAAGALDAHLEAAVRAERHLGRPVGVQGRIRWDPEHEISDVMRFLAPAGPQFYFVGRHHGERVPFSSVLGSNVSFPTGWLRQEPFDESLRHAAMEDTEVAWRQHRRGWTTVWSETAVAWHHHPYPTLEPFLERQRRAGGSAVSVLRRHPRLFAPLLAQPTAFGAVVWLRRLLGRGKPTDDWDLACRAAFAQGAAAHVRDLLSARRNGAR
ncbi:MAG: glycosyltransferase family 2 protein [Acidobacteriota bacterium]